MSNEQVIIDREAPGWAQRLNTDLNMALNRLSRPRTVTRAVSEFGYNVVSYGADNTGAADSHAAVQSVIDEAPSGSTVYFPPGDYIFSASLAYADKALSFTSLGGPDSVRMRFYDCSGIEVTLSDQPTLDDPWTLRVTGLNIATNNQSDATGYMAISVQAPDLLTDGGTSQWGVIIDNCIFDGNERFEQWWPFSVYIRNVSNNRITNCMSYAKANHAKGFGFVFSGHSTVCYVNSCELYFNVVAIQQDGTGYTNWASEGLIVDRCGIRAAIGVRKIHDVANGEPQFQVSNCHINCTVACIYTSNAYEIQITDCLLYLQEMAFEAIDANPVGIWLTDSSVGTPNTKFTVRGMQIRILTTPSGLSRGVLIDMSVGVIDACIFEAFDRGIEIAATRSDIHVSRNNRYISCTTSVLNSGVSNTQDAATVAL
jgi:hypothetical protein